MKSHLKLVAPFVVALAAAACSANGGSPSVPGMTGQSVARMHPARARVRKLWGPNVAQVCSDVPVGYVNCLALLRTDIAQSMNPATVAGLTPADFQSAYALPSSSKGTGQVVAVVDAYDNPRVASDLATYRSQFGLPAANFTKYNQNGETGDYPEGGVYNWALEIDLDVEMVSATCPNCTIYLIEANGFDKYDMETAEAEAVTLGAHIVSNSWGCPRSNKCLDSSYFDTPGVTYLAGGGDGGYGTIAPAALGSVVSVGGTMLVKSSGKRGWTETAWSSTGAGCASGIKRPSWQHDPDCKYRVANDVAADADPSTGAAEFDSYGYGGWFVVGGNSVSTPLLAGVFGLAGNAASQDGGKTFWEKPHEKAKDLYPITSGSDGTCSPKYFCTDGTNEYGKYGGPTGWGTPHGIGAF